MEKESFQEDGELQEILGRFEKMLSRVESCFFAGIWSCMRV